MLHLHQYCILSSHTTWREAFGPLDKVRVNYCMWVYLSFITRKSHEYHATQKLFFWFGVFDTGIIFQKTKISVVKSFAIMQHQPIRHHMSMWDGWEATCSYVITNIKFQVFNGWEVCSHAIIYIKFQVWMDEKYAHMHAINYVKFQSWMDEKYDRMG